MQNQKGARAGGKCQCIFSQNLATRGRQQGKIQNKGHAAKDAGYNEKDKGAAAKTPEAH